MSNPLVIRQQPRTLDDLTHNGGILIAHKKRSAPELEYDTVYAHNHDKMVVVYKLKQPSTPLRNEWVSFLILTTFGWYLTPAYKMCDEGAPGAPKTFSSIFVENKDQSVILFLNRNGEGLPPALIQGDEFRKWTCTTPLNPPRNKHVIRAAKA